MTDQDIPNPTPETNKAPWTKPVLEPAGTIHDVEGGARPGLDTNHLPAHS